MKRKLIFLVIAIVAAVTPMTGYASEKRFLAEVADLPETKYTNIDADILRRSDNKVTFSNISGLGIGLEKVKSFEVIECDNAESIAKLEDFAKKLEEVASDSAGKQMLEFAIAMYEKNNSGK